MTTTNTNKQPVFVDRPLIERKRITNQVVGAAGNLNVLGGQNPALIVDMDATLTSDNNSGGIVDSITIVRDNFSAEQTEDYVINSTTSGDYISITSGQTVHIAETGVTAVPAESGIGYYTYTGVTPIEGYNTALIYSGDATPLTSGFTFTSVTEATMPSVTFVCYHTRQTTVPIPANGDYGIVFSKTVPTNRAFVDCSDVMPELLVPMPEAGNTTGIGNATPLKNRGIYLQRGDRLYMGVLQNGVYNTPSGYTPGAHVISQGGYF
jgi:hypothetical protein